MSEYLDIVVLHGVERGNVAPAVRAVMQERRTDSASIRSFTDLKSRQNPHNAGLSDALRGSDVLLIADDCLATVAGRMALGALSHDSIRVFDERYETSVLELPRD